MQPISMLNITDSPLSLNIFQLFGMVSSDGQCHTGARI